MASASISRRHAGRMPTAPARKMGTWKLAYADFLTALAAFFLLMWLVSGMSPGARVEIATYFRAADSGKAPPAAAAVNLSDRFAASADTERLYAALRLSPELVAAGDSLILTETPDGVRIDLVDRGDRALFTRGDGRLTPAGVALATAVGAALAPFTHSLTIEGHTDAFSGAGGAFSNWDLSAARALDARRALTLAGVDPLRIKAVTGLADTAPLAPGEPHLAANRRISLVLAPAE
jgi:chemotaxis protein MotB